MFGKGKKSKLSHQFGSKDQDDDLKVVVCMSVLTGNVKKCANDNLNFVKFGCDIFSDYNMIKIYLGNKIARAYIA